MMNRASRYYVENVRLRDVVGRIRSLHTPMNGPYDDLACKHCTDIVDPIATAVKITQPIYVEYPCPTIKALEEKWDPLEHPVPRPDEETE
jgi:hypothetical protein